MRWSHYTRFVLHGEENKRRGKTGGAGGGRREKEAISKPLHNCVGKAVNARKPEATSLLPSLRSTKLHKHSETAAWLPFSTPLWV